MGGWIAAPLVALVCGGVEIDTNYPGGNVVVASVAGEASGVTRIASSDANRHGATFRLADRKGGAEPLEIGLKTDLRDTGGWWFYWNFRVRGAEGRELRFRFDQDAVGLQGAAVSRDGGLTWRWLGPKSGNSRSFAYRFAADERDVRFAMAIPYLQADWERFLASQQGRPLTPAVLCKSRHGRDVEYVRFGRLEAGGGATADKPAVRVAITCRHHACESAASYVLEGLIAAVLRPETDDARWLASHAAFLAVPFVDKDGVEEGDQGKNRRPRDHNRDYRGDSIYPETKALRELLPGWFAGGPAVAIDVHCPYIRGDYDTWIYQVGQESERIAVEQRRFVDLIAAASRGPLFYRKTGFLPHGKAWNTAASYREGKSFARWAAERDEVRLATSFEIPYAVVGGEAVSPEGCRAFGRDLAAALAAYLRTPDGPRKSALR